MSALDRDAAREVLGKYMGVQPNHGFVALLDALEACVRPDGLQSIDREALIEVFIDYEAQVWSVAQRNYGVMPDQGGYANRILALLQPVDGVVITREEAS